MVESEKTRLGHRIRSVRKDRGLSISKLAEKVGVNYATIHRVETGKVSPSVVLLSEIAQVLGYSVVNLLEEKSSPLKIVRAEEQPELESDLLRVRLLAPKGLISDKMSISLGQAEVGKFVSKHTTKGYEMAYIQEGVAIFDYGGQEYELRKGDLIYFDGSTAHSVKALKPLVFLAIHFSD